MRIPEPVSRAWGGLPLPYQAAIVVAVLVALLVAAGGASLAVSHWKDRRFDAKEAERAEERTKIEAARDAAIGRAQVLEGQAAVQAAQIEAQKLLLAKSSKAIAEQDKKVEEVVRAYNADIDTVDSGASPGERAADIRKRLVALGLLPQ